MNYVYLIRCNDGHFQTKYKIGIAQDVQTRLAQLQTGSPYVLEVMECYGYENAEVVERALHQAFKKQRIQGEWFILDNIQATETLPEICVMLGGTVGIVEDKSEPDEVEEAEEMAIPTDGGKFDYAAMFADGWRMEKQTNGRKVGEGCRYWGWRRGSKNPKEYIYGGTLASLPYPIEEMRKIFDTSEERRHDL